MDTYFFDSSAIVKRYVKEVGTAWVLDSTDPAKANDIYVVQLTGVEVVSARVRKVPPLTPPNLARALADFKQDFQHQYQRIAVNEAVVNRAMQLVETYRLRGYDAVQLATAVEMRLVGITTKLPSLIFVSSDSRLNQAAAAEGLTVDNPMSHP
jgi:predicted nucleic acid-binding protein